ncbi:MAG: hypothetical protein ABSB97_00605 [Thermoplasmata archaeon]
MQRTLKRRAWTVGLTVSVLAIMVTGVALSSAVGLQGNTRIESASPAVHVSGPSSRTSAGTVGGPMPSVSWRGNIVPQTVPTYVGWGGWDGNRAIYPSMDRNPTYISPVTNSSFWYQTSSNSSVTPVANSALVTLATTGSNESWYAYEPGGIGAGWILHLYFTGFGASTEYTEGQGEYWFVDYQDVSEQIATMPASTHVDVETAYDSGINITNGNAAAGSQGQELSSAIGVALDVATVAFPPAGFALDPISVLLGLVGTAGGNNGGALTTTTGQVGGNVTVNQWGQVTFNSYPLSGGWDGFGQSVYVENTVPLTSGGYLPRISGNGGSVTIGEQNQIGEQPSSNYGWPNTNAQGATLRYPIWPAVSIGGPVDLYPNGPAAPNAGVLLAETSCASGVPSIGAADYSLTANAQGHWHFFADPGCTYTAYASGSNPDQGGTLTSSTLTIPTAVTSLTNEGNNTTVSNLNLAGGPVTFTGSGGNGGSWTVTLNGAARSSTGTAISLLEPNGTYSYSVTPPNGYSASPSSGSVTVSGGSVNVAVTFTKLPAYSVTFSESGLPSGDTWDASVNGGEKTATAPSSISFSGLAGSNSYSVGEVVVFDYCGVVEYYAPSPSSGTVTSATTVSVTFTYHVTGNPVNRCIPDPRGSGAVLGPFAWTLGRASVPVSARPLALAALGRP